MTEQQLAYARAEQQRLDARETYQFWSHFDWNTKYLAELAEESRRRNLEQVVAGTGQPNWSAETSPLMCVDSLSPAHDDGVVWRSPSGEAGSWHPEETEADGSVSWRSPSEPEPLTSSTDAVSSSTLTWAEPEASAGVSAPTRPVEQSDPSLSPPLQPIQAGGPPPEVPNPVPTLQIRVDPQMSALLPKDPAMAERQIQDLNLLSRLVAEAVRSGAAGDRDREAAHREAAVQVYSFWSQFYRDQDRLQRLCERMHDLSQEAIRRAEELRLLQVESDKINADPRTLGKAQEIAILQDLASQASIESITGTAKRRFLDLYEEKIGVGEVKWVARVSLTEQLTDSILFALVEGLPYYLITRTNTTLSGPVQKLIADGVIEWIPCL